MGKMPVEWEGDLVWVIHVQYCEGCGFYKYFRELAAAIDEKWPHEFLIDSVKQKHPKSLEILPKGHFVIGPAFKGVEVPGHTGAFEVSVMCEDGTEYICHSRRKLKAD